MGNSALLAKFIGPYIILVAFGLLFNLKACQRIMDDFSKSYALIYITGLITFAVGLAIAVSHNVWAKDWRLIVTLFGWSALIKGAWLVLSPDTVKAAGAFFMKNFKFVLIPWTIMLALGVFLTFKGYCA